MSDDPSSDGAKPPERASRGRRDLDDSSGAESQATDANTDSEAEATAATGAAEAGGGRWTDTAGFPFAAEQPVEDRSKALIAAAIGFVVLLGVGIGAYVLGGGNGADDSDAGPATSTTTVAVSDATGVVSETTTTETEPTTTVDASTTTLDVTTTTVAATTTTEQPVVTVPAVDATTSPGGRPLAPEGAPVVPRFGSYAAGKLTLLGSVPSDEVADQIFERAAEVIGADNVIDTYVVDPRAPESSDGQIRVNEPILFPTASAEITPDLIPILDLGVLIMQLNPQAEMIIEGHTDSRGDEASNLELSIRRAQAIVDYLVNKGVESERLQPLGVGETDPVAPNETAEGRALNRRIEVEILNLLG